MKCCMMPMSGTGFQAHQLSLCPDWYIKGLINYVSFGWDYEAENRVKDGIMSGKYKNISHLEYEDAVYAGHSFWRFIGKEYGDALIPNIIYLTKSIRISMTGFFMLSERILRNSLRNGRNSTGMSFQETTNSPDMMIMSLQNRKKNRYTSRLK